MDTKTLRLVVGGILVLALTVATPWVAICGVAFLWFVHRSASGELSKPVMFRSVAAGGIAGGVVASSAVVAIQLVVADALKDKDFLIHSRFPDHDDGLFSVAMKWTLLASCAYSVVTALLFAWAVTLVVDFLPQHNAKTSTVAD